MAGRLVDCSGGWLVVETGVESGRNDFSHECRGGQYDLDDSRNPVLRVGLESKRETH